MKTIFKLIVFFTLLGLNYGYSQTYSEILGRPTDVSINLSLLFNQHVDVYAEYGTISGNYSQSTTPITNVVNIPNHIDLTNLQPNTKYYYRTRYRQTGVGTYLMGTEHSFYTQRAVGSTFTFTVEADVHLYDKKGCENEYKIALANQAADHPDFMIDMGDTYGDDHNPFTITSAQVDSLHKVYRPLLGSICHSIPYYFCVGNHEGEKRYYLLQTPPNNLGIYATLARKKYFANPVPNSFYTGDTLHEGYGMGQPENYYAWTWGNALFVVMDVYRYDNDTTEKPVKWDWTIGLPQYTWLKNTLEGSTAQYKFVFAHHVSGEGRGGAVQAHFYEWGGYENNGTTFGFTTKRPGWAKPIHQLFVDNGVNIFFQGHDHLFAHEELGGVIYQEVPMPSDSTYEIGMVANADAYTADTIGGSGHLRVTVSPVCVKVDFVRAYLPIDTLSGVHHNREVAFSYTIGDCSTLNVPPVKAITKMNLYPNPSANVLYVSLTDMATQNAIIKIYNTMGQEVYTDTFSTSTNLKINTGNLPNGVYTVLIETKESIYSDKFIKVY